MSILFHVLLLVVVLGYVVGLIKTFTHDNLLIALAWMVGSIAWLFIAFPTACYFAHVNGVDKLFGCPVGFY